MKYIKDYIQHCLYNQKYSFSKQEVLEVLGISLFQYQAQIQRLVKKGEVNRVARNFFMIAPVEHSQLGMPAILRIIDPLMKYLKREDYYIGLLSAAFFHNAVENEPVNLQIIASKAVRDIELPDCKIEFHVSKESSVALKEQVTLPIGQVSISSKEQTILDLVRFHQDCGYLSGVMPVIKKLVEVCSLVNFSAAIVNEKNTALLQRLGYILEFIQLEELASIVEKELSKRKIQPILLRPDLNRSDKRNERLKIVVNDSLEG